MLKLHGILLKMVISFLKIRLVQLRREAAALGWLRVLLVVLLMIPAGVVIYKQMNRYPNCLYTAGFAALLTGMVHINRSDKMFILLTGIHPLKLYMAEYLFFSMPVFILMLFSTHWYAVFIPAAACIIIPFLNFIPGGKVRPGRALSYIPRDNFEWISGIRKNFLPVLCLYLAALGLLFYPYASLFVLWLLVGIIASFYQECEPMDILQLAELPPADFIRRKLNTHLKTGLIFSAPVIVGYVLFHPADVWIALLVYAFLMVNLSFFILSKYAVYAPDRRTPANSALVSLVHLCMLVPFLLPLPLLMGVRAYKKSLRNLEPYLDAYH